MQVRVAKTAGFCFGVRRAVEMVAREAAAGSGAVTLGPIIHNRHVVEEFAAQGVRPVETPGDAPEGGTVSVRVKCGERHVQLTVADTGRGIEPERLAHIFERYLDTDRLDPAPPHGLGVGLSLCRRIAQGHGGMLVAESAVGKGTAFTLSLPNARSTDLSLSDRRFDYAGGFDHVLMELSDALPSRAFLQKYLD